MNSEAQKVIDIANREVGTKETPVNRQKYSKYFDDLRNQGIFVYNYKKQGVAWCDIFVDYCFAQAFGPVEGMKKIFQPMKGTGAGCKFSAQFYRNNNAFYPYPMVGDQVFFGPSGNESHTGIVTKVTKDRFYTVEGNTSNMVKAHSYSNTNKRISGFGRPNYTAVAKPDPKPTKPDPKPARPTYNFPKIPAYGFFANGDSGAEVKKMQNILLAIKPNCLPRYGADGIVGNETLRAVAEIQRIVNTPADRLYGNNTNKACKLYLGSV